VLAILGGAGAALAWGAATLCSSRSTRLIGAAPVLAWVMVVGLVAVAPFVALGPGPGSLGAGDVAWLVVGGVGNAGGLLLEYTGLRLGKVGVVAPIASTEGAIAALIAIGAGETLSAAVAATLAVSVAGVVLTARPAADEIDGRPGDVGLRNARVAALFGVGAALSFGVSLYGIGHLSGDLPAAWILLPARLAGVVMVALPLLVAGRLTLTRAAVPLVVVAGLCEVIGFASYTAGAQHDIAIAAVLSSQFAAVAALAAFVAFRERLARHQVLGVVGILCGVAVLSVLQA
jgi:drug/metabolite transporter (DMT)-like permease